MKTKTKKSPAKELPTPLELSARLVTIVHNTIEALVRSNNDQMFNTDAFVLEQVAQWLQLGIPKTTIGEAAGLAIDRLLFEEEDRKRIAEQWFRRIKDIEEDKFIERTFEECREHDKSPDRHPFDFFEIQPVTPRPADADWWFGNKDMIVNEERLLQIVESQRKCMRKNEIIENLSKQIKEEKDRLEAHPDLAAVLMSRENGIPVRLSGPSFENAASYYLKWNETFRRQCAMQHAHPGQHFDIAAWDAELDKITDEHKAKALQPSDDFNDIVKNARAQTKESSMLESLLDALKKQAEMKKEYAEKLEREEVARRLQAAKDAGKPITVTEAANQLSGSGEMLERLNGYKNKGSLDVAVRHHAKSIFKDLQIDVMEFVRTRKSK